MYWSGPMEESDQLVRFVLPGADRSFHGEITSILMLGRISSDTLLCYALPCFTIRKVLALLSNGSQHPG
jgi:hypothetical protein